MRRLVSIATLLMTLSVLGQTGIVQGKVFFKRDLEALTGVGIFLPARSLGATSDLEGNYRLELDSGMHNLIVQSMGFATDTIIPPLRYNLDFIFIRNYI